MYRYVMSGATLFLFACIAVAPGTVAAESEEDAIEKSILEPPSKMDQKLLKWLSGSPKSAAGTNKSLTVRTAKSTESPISKSSANNFARLPDESMKASTSIAGLPVKKNSTQPKARSADAEKEEITDGFAYVLVENTHVGAPVTVELDGKELDTIYPSHKMQVKVATGPHTLRVIDAEKSRDKLPNWKDFKFDFKTSLFETVTIYMTRGESEDEAMQIGLMREATLVNAIAVPSK